VVAGADDDRPAQQPAVALVIDPHVAPGVVVADAARDAREMVAMTPRDAARPRADATVRVDAAALDAPPDAAIVADAVDAGVATSRIVVYNDTWCDVWIDDKSHGRLLRRPIIVSPGHHTVRCEQPGTQRRWAQEVDVAPGETATARGALLATVNVTIAISQGSEVMIDNVHYPPNGHAKVAAGRREVTIPGVAKAFVTITSNCTIRDVPELGCY
jgi:hypothetical protein